MTQMICRISMTFIYLPDPNPLILNLHCSEQDWWYLKEIQELRWLSRAFPLCIKQEIHSKATIFIIIRLNKVLLVNIMANPIRDSSTIVCQRLAWVRVETSWTWCRAIIRYKIMRISLPAKPLPFSTSQSRFQIVVSSFLVHLNLI